VAPQPTTSAATRIEMEIRPYAITSTPDPSISDSGSTFDASSHHSRHPIGSPHFAALPHQVACASSFYLYAEPIDSGSSARPTHYLESGASDSRSCARSTGCLV
jgi:hypothetical protein